MHKYLALISILGLSACNITGLAGLGAQTFSNAGEWSFGCTSCNGWDSDTPAEPTTNRDQRH